jgi:mannitol/fructose-specific phosphotransferase system IIA component (Ntr-type)
MKRLTEWLSPDLVILDHEAKTEDEALAALADLSVRAGIVPPESREALVKALEERELLASTALKHGVAVPHAYVDIVKRESIAILRTREPVPFHGRPTDLYLFVSGPSRKAAEHLQVLARLARLLRDERFIARLREVKTAEEAIAAFREAETTKR